MTSSSPRKGKGARFLDLVEQVGEVAVTVFATSKHPLSSSDSSMLAARRLIGGLPQQGDRLLGRPEKLDQRVGRLAQKLDRLVAADQAGIRERAVGE